MIVRGGSGFEGKKGEAQTLGKDRPRGQKSGQGDERRELWSAAALLWRGRGRKSIGRVAGGHLQ